MKPILIVLCLHLAIVPCAQNTATAAPPKTEQIFDPNAVVSVVIVSVPKATAAELLSKPDIKTNARESLDSIHKLVAAGKATYFANPSLKVMSGNMASTKSLTELEVEAIVGPDGVTVDMSIFLRYAAGEIKTRLSTKRGATLFAGSADPKPDAATTDQQPSTHLIFVRVQ